MWATWRTESTPILGLSLGSGKIHFRSNRYYHLRHRRSERRQLVKWPIQRRLVIREDLLSYVREPQKESSNSEDPEVEAFAPQGDILTQRNEFFRRGKKTAASTIKCSFRHL